MNPTLPLNKQITSDSIVTAKEAVERERGMYAQQRLAAMQTAWLELRSKELRCEVPSYTPSAVSQEPGARELAQAAALVGSNWGTLVTLGLVVGALFYVGGKLERLGQGYDSPERGQAALVGRAVSYFEGGSKCLNAVEVGALKAQFGPLVAGVLTEREVSQESAAGRVLGQQESSASCELLKKNWDLVTRPAR